MAEILIIKKTDGSIASTYEADVVNQQAYGGPWGDPEQTAHVVLPEGYDKRACSAQETEAATAVAMHDGVTYFAADLGAAGNDIELIFDGVKTIGQVVNEWNNYNNGVDVLEDSEDDSIVPIEGTVRLSGGADAGWQIIEDEQLKLQLQEQDVIANTESLVANARAFGTKLLDQFAAENIRLGITADGMTKTVRTAMADVQLALQTGSLYDALIEVRYIPAENKDAKYVTDERLLLYGNKLRAYLGLPAVSDLADL